MSDTLFGLDAMLVLRDGDDEFEVRDPFKREQNGVIRLDISRIADAIDSRERDSLTPTRKVY
jgi:hypothetical protein